MASRTPISPWHRVARHQRASSVAPSIPGWRTIRASPGDSSGLSGLAVGVCGPQSLGDGVMRAIGEIDGPRRARVGASRFTRVGLHRALETTVL
ncbi:hypothetical protein FA13DRAFT_1743991, partial [Coprinellus micaceus]